MQHQPTYILRFADGVLLAGEISQIKAVLARLADKGDTSIILREKCAENEDKSVIPPDAQ